MHTSTPPKLAIWLLLNFGSGANVEALLGDLQERWRTRPSRRWYWREVLLAIIISGIEEVRSHKLIAVRAVVIGWLALYATVQVFAFLRYTLSVVANGGVDVAGYWIVLPTAYSQWMWRYGLYTDLTTNAVAAALSGWIVGRLHARSAGPMFLAYGASVFAWLSVGWIVNARLSSGPASIYLLNISVVMLGIMCGGILAVGRRRLASRLATSRS